MYRYQCPPYDPEALGHFDEHEVVIPITVIEELDRFKKTTTKPAAMLALFLAVWINFAGRAVWLQV